MRAVFFEVFPYLKHSNQDGYLQLEVPPPPSDLALAADADFASAIVPSVQLSHIAAVAMQSPTGIWAEPADDVNMESMDRTGWAGKAQPAECPV